ncbi:MULTISPECIES: 2-oxoacid:acceptor oxidoreductase family protein [Oceanotoga]|jgi:indolepyruvate ferredoxin oxidoreductase beta subunit|uniref:Indolepyruvate ferredoxin oxidoreductase beta subunit n=1 Tax=Oceanotoga teriensis TaxID=515440 RepID=A0AA45HJU6_9BACT|nr:MULTISPECIES: 2-oxoacid:acceptor oxidoreductase family protein [Oceanotoga]MDN5341640.1 indolepyruvate ferredoxin oxidoreductase, beta subunit [Oceanotoga sp.]MDO7977158.1 2-oxoacid:acceptor oxidoreductase family protein [Oceanotoga teriensis]PWJ96571.1 indolepyruvate ferredoxin oxidoreductase beta subunit [Oceanotoga teriensis]
MRQNIYIIGVGGQGIGLLSEVIIRAADYAGLPVMGVDTHGLAQRGGTVQSHVRIGEGIHSALIKKGYADIVISLERTEALRGVNEFLKDGGSLIYYDTSWQTLSVRLGKDKEITNEDINKICKERNIKVYRVFDENLEDARMQNVVVLNEIKNNEIIKYIKREDYLKALKDLLPEYALEKNLRIFE